MTTCYIARPALESLQRLVEKDVTEPRRLPPILGQHQGQDFHDTGYSNELVREDHLQQRLRDLHQIVLRIQEHIHQEDQYLETT